MGFTIGLSTSSLYFCAFKLPSIKCYCVHFSIGYAFPSHNHPPSLLTLFTKLTSANSLPSWHHTCGLWFWGQLDVLPNSLKQRRRRLMVEKWTMNIRFTCRPRHNCYHFCLEEMSIQQSNNYILCLSFTPAMMCIDVRRNKMVWSNVFPVVILQTDVAVPSQRIPPFKGGLNAPIPHVFFCCSSRKTRFVSWGCGSHVGVLCSLYRTLSVTVCPSWVTIAQHRHYHFLKK
jgi:hypothetical protein